MRRTWKTSFRICPLRFGVGAELIEGTPRTGAVGFCHSAYSLTCCKLLYQKEDTGGNSIP